MFLPSLTTMYSKWGYLKKILPYVYLNCLVQGALIPYHLCLADNAMIMLIYLVSANTAIIMCLNS